MKFYVQFFKKKFVDNELTYIRVGNITITHNSSINIYKRAFLNAPNKESKSADKIIFEKL